MLQHPETHAHPGYASIMVPVGVDGDSENRVKIGCQLADRFGARLIGVSGRALILPIYGTDGQIIDGHLVEVEEQRTKDDLAASETLFHRIVGKRNDVEWRGATCDATRFATEQARAADLIVVSRRGPKDRSEEIMDVRPGDLVMAAGRPILLIPPERTNLPLKQVVIAWKDTREARRAVWDSLPLLRYAESVSVVTVGEEADRETVADVKAYLARHGIKAPLSVVLGPDLGGCTEAVPVMRFAEAEGADLIVAGGYGHSRIREWLFGGVTRTLLDETPIPCLLAH